jgi:glycosyltransferase involved in cell wall biosynthesis
MDSRGLLRRYLIGTRRYTSGINPRQQRLYPLFGLINYVAAHTLSAYRAESVRFAAVPIFERWVLRQLEPGDHLFAGFGYLNRCLEWVKHRGGLIMLDARNSHPSNFWSLIAEEYARWDCQLPPVYPLHHMRQQRSAVLADYVFTSSKFVTESFTSRGFSADRVLETTLPVDLTLFSPPSGPRPKDRPLTILNTGQLSLRKGTPYLMEAFELVRKEVPNARLLLTRNLASNFEPIFCKKGWDKLPIEWDGYVPYDQYAKRFQNADIFVMPSIEEGMVYTVAEAMGCGCPVVVTPNTGTADKVEDGVNGSILPIRDSGRLAREILKWWAQIQKGEFVAGRDPLTLKNLSPETYAEKIIRHLKYIGLIEQDR